MIYMGFGASYYWATFIRAAKRVATQQGTHIHAIWGKPAKCLTRLTKL